MTPHDGFGSKEAEGLEENNPILHLLDASDTAVVAVNAALEIISWNRAAKLIFGWETTDIIGQEIAVLAPDAGLAEALEIACHPSGTHFEVLCQTKLGQTICVHVWACSSSSNGGRQLLMRDVTECKFLEHAFLDAAEREQRRIGREMHDYLCQHILGAAFAVKALASDLDREGSRHAVKLHDLARLVNEAVTQVRDISRGLHPVELECAGLPAALEGLASRVSRTVPCDFSCEEKSWGEASDPAIHAYRIAQEAVLHALEKTGATKIAIRLSEKDGSFLLEITDDGAKEGPLTNDPNDLASKSLQYRARAIHGELCANFHDGTHISCTFPHAA